MFAKRVSRAANRRLSGTHEPRRTQGYVDPGSRKALPCLAGMTAEVVSLFKDTKPADVPIQPFQPNAILSNDLSPNVSDERAIARPPRAR